MVSRGSEVRKHEPRQLQVLVSSEKAIIMKWIVTFFADEQTDPFGQDTTGVIK